MLLDKNKPLIGDHPYRYAAMDLDGAQELGELIKETDELLRKFEREPFAKRVFAAHSESDETANITGIEALQRVSQPGPFEFFRIAESVGVPHASVVLKEPIRAPGAAASDEPLEKENPLFQDMMAAISTMA